MIYILNFDRASLKDPRIFHQLVTSIKGIDDWCHYLPSMYLIYSKTIKPYHVGEVIHQFYPALNFLVTYFEPAGYKGYLHPDAWEWINKYRTKISLPIKPPILAKIASAPLRSKSVADILGSRK